MNEWWEETLGFPPTTHFQIGKRLLLFLVEARACAQVNWRGNIVTARGSRGIIKATIDVVGIFVLQL